MAVTTKAGPMKTLGPCEAINSVTENEKPDEEQVFHTSAILSRARMRSPFNHSTTLPSLYKYPTPSTHNPLFCPLWVWSDRENTKRKEEISSNFQTKPWISGSESEIRETQTRNRHKFSGRERKKRAFCELDPLFPLFSSPHLRIYKGDLVLLQCEFCSGQGTKHPSLRFSSF